MLSGILGNIIYEIVDNYPKILFSVMFGNLFPSVYLLSCHYVNLSCC